MKRLAFAAAAAVLASNPALAAHGKAGLWQISIQSSMTGMLTPAQEQKMRAMGMRLPNRGNISVQHCMTPQEVAMDKPPPMSRGKECATRNVRISGQSFAADIVCTGTMSGRGHSEVTFDSAQHYRGRVNFSGAMRGRTVNTTMTIEGRWLAASCGAVKH